MAWTRGNCKTRRETFKFGGLVPLILEVWRYVYFNLSNAGTRSWSSLFLMVSSHPTIEHIANCSIKHGFLKKFSYLSFLINFLRPGTFYKMTTKISGISRHLWCKWFIINTKHGAIISARAIFFHSHKQRSSVSKSLWPLVCRPTLASVTVHI